MLFVKTFKGYEDRTADLDEEVNNWVVAHRNDVEVVDIKVALAHEQNSSAGTGDLIYVVVYRSGAPVFEGPGSQLPPGFEL